MPNQHSSQVTLIFVGIKSFVLLVSIIKTDLQQHITDLHVSLSLSSWRKIQYMEHISQDMNAKKIGLMFNVQKEKTTQL